MENYGSIKSVMRSFYRAVAAFGQQFRYPGCSLNEAIIIGIIGRHPDISASQLSGFIAIDSGYLCRLLKKLEAEGILTRSAEKKPPFVKHLRLTPRGRRISRETGAILDASIEEHLSALDPAGLKAFSDAMEQLSQSLSQLVPDSLPRR